MGGNSPCASCKLLRHRCANDCIFAPYFPSDDPDKFAIVHKVFGTSKELPVQQRADAVSSLVYEANARARDPVYGCGTNRLLSEFSDVIVPHRLTQPDNAPGWDIEEFTIAMNGYTITKIGDVCFSDQPVVEYLAVLRHINVSTSDKPTLFPPSTSWMVDGQDIE
ncbi:LOB domain-containing protein 4 [Hibiscus syriacus]|uniref:LOB domain-containing protein 4 n=1 Tax=Hibiscus syriacus TaxID=106335 RepID=A0A6A2ZU68_HIBSY|nr:LOB domain-containing protein 4 [Hibiscus syriacus]